MKFWGMLLAAATVGAGAMGCGGDDGHPLQIVLNVSSPCETTSSGAGGESAMASSSSSSTSATAGTGGAGGSGGAEPTTTTSSGSSTTASGSSSASGTGGGGPCVPTKCDPTSSCGDYDDGCGTMLHCGGCDGAVMTDKVTCDPVVHVCRCTSALGNAEAVALCQAEGSGGVPFFCGPVPTSPKVGDNCNYGGQTMGNESVACCAP